MNTIDIDYIEAANNLSQVTGIRYETKGYELLFQRCPYCGKAKKFSINKNTGQYQCFRASCGKKGNIYTLAQDFEISLGRDANEYFGVGPRRHYRIFKKKDPIKPKDAAIEYLKSRGISSEIAEKYQITASEDGNIIFPFFDESDQMQFVKYRNPHPEEGQSKEWCEKNCKPILFGMNRCNLDNKTIIITEGQMDSLSVAEAGFENAVSVPNGCRGFTWVPHVWDWIKNFNQIIVFGDYENGKISLFADISSRWGSKTWHVRPEDYKDCKDANEILQKYGAEQIRKCINNAERLPLKNMVKLSKVEYLNPYDLPKVATGIYKIDDLLCGGLPLGQMVLLTGKAGEGKSTLGSQLLVNAIEQGYKIFAYSGELPNYIFKNWIDLQAAGNSNINSNQGKWGIYHTVKEEALQQINGWYDDRIWIYDNSQRSGEEEGESESLITMIENSITQYGVNVVFIDNLMTGIDLELDLLSDKYERQSVFIKRLIKIALEYNVLIILIAHKKKGYTEVNESVSGTLDIINLASIVMSYETIPKKMLESDEELSPEDRLLKVTKNRLFGTTNEHGFVMHYSPKSKRVFASDAELRKQYTWKQYEEPEVEEFPFQ